MNEALAQNTRANLLPGFLYEGVTLTPDLESEFLYKGAILAPYLQIYYIIYFFLCQVIPIRKYAEDVSVLYVIPLFFMPVQTYLQAFLYPKLFMKIFQCCVLVLFCLIFISFTRNIGIISFQICTKFAYYKRNSVV